jgi:hypothetical protein
MSDGLDSGSSVQQHHGIGHHGARKQVCEVGKFTAEPLSGGFRIICVPADSRRDLIETGRVQLCFFNQCVYSTEKVLRETFGLLRSVDLGWMVRHWKEERIDCEKLGAYGMMSLYQISSWKRLAESLGVEPSLTRMLRSSCYLCELTYSQGHSVVEPETYIQTRRIGAAFDVPRSFQVWQGQEVLSFIVGLEHCPILRPQIAKNESVFLVSTEGHPRYLKVKWVLLPLAWNGRTVCLDACSFYIIYRLHRFLWLLYSKGVFVMHKDYFPKILVGRCLLNVGRLIAWTLGKPTIEILSGKTEQEFWRSLTCIWEETHLIEVGPFVWKGNGFSEEGFVELDDSGDWFEDSEIQIGFTG